MVELLLSAPAPVCLALVGTLLVCLLMVCLPLVVFPTHAPHHPRGQPAPPLTPAQRAFRRAYLRTVGLGLPSLLVLSGCGTALSQAETPLQVPAELLTPPQAPVMLTPALPSKKPGPTTSRTRLDAASTASTTSG